MISWRRFNVARKEGGYSREKACRFPYEQKPDAQPLGRGHSVPVAESATGDIFSGGQES